MKRERTVTRDVSVLRQSISRRVSMVTGDIPGSGRVFFFGSHLINLTDCLRGFTHLMHLMLRQL